MMQRDKRIRVWQHNSFFGHCKMGQVHMQAIINSPSTTEETKQTAKEIEKLLDKLSFQLKDRIDA